MMLILCKIVVLFHFSGRPLYAPAASGRVRFGGLFRYGRHAVCAVSDYKKHGVCLEILLTP